MFATIKQLLLVLQHKLYLAVYVDIYEQSFRKSFSFQTQRDSANHLKLIKSDEAKPQTPIRSDAAKR
jgi:hypothetical protein